MRKKNQAIMTYCSVSSTSNMLTVSFLRIKNPFLLKGCPGYDTKLYLIVRLQFWSGKNPFITITTRFPLIKRGSTSYGFPLMSQIDLLANVFVLVILDII